MLEENRLNLIRRWSMDGAHDDLGIRAAPATHAGVVVADARVDRSLPPVFMKHADEDDWRPLTAAAVPA